MGIGPICMELLQILDENLAVLVGNLAILARVLAILAGNLANLLFPKINKYFWRFLLPLCDSRADAVDAKKAEYS